MDDADRELVAFVVEAKRNIYAAEKPNEIVLPDGGRKLVYENGLYVYEDVYYGFEEFYGREIAFKRGEESHKWIMQYSGLIPVGARSSVDPTRVYADLKSALREVSLGLPFRGPRSFRAKHFSYFCEVKGDPNFFFGHESLRWLHTFSDKKLRGKLAYFGAFHGLIQG